MLQAIYKNPAGQHMQVEWKIGTPSPFKNAPQIVWTVGEVSASGSELDWIKSMITGIPVANAATVIWYGDFAKFIAGNLPC